MVNYKKIVLKQNLINKWGSEFSSYKIDLRNRVTQNDITLPVVHSKIFIEIIFWSHWLDFVKY